MEIFKKPLTIENLQNALDKSQKIDNQLKDAYFGLNQKIQFYEQKFKRMDPIVESLEECQTALLKVQKEYHATKDSSLFTSPEYIQNKEEFARLEQLIKDEGFFDVFEYKRVKSETFEDKQKSSEYIQMIEKKDREISMISQYLNKYTQSNDLTFMKGDIQKNDTSASQIFGGEKGKDRSIQKGSRC